MKPDIILQALTISKGYLAKAVADDLMADCVRPPRYGLNLVEAAIAERKAEQQQDQTRKLYDIQFRRGDRLTTWQRWATSTQEARTSATKALEEEYPEGFRIVSIEEVT